MSVMEHALTQVSDARVLVVDDSPANTALVKRLLGRAGLASVIELQDPTKVQQYLAEGDLDLVLLDLRMPVMDGFEVLEVIRRQSMGSYLPVIVITADDSHESVERALAGGAHDFVNKPFNAAELILRVRNLLLNRYAYQELRRSRAVLRSRLDLFEPNLAKVNADPQEIRRLIRRTIDEEGVRIAIQPIINMSDGTLVGGEALARFPGGVLENPSAWFAAALEVGMVTELELAAVRRALTHVPTRPAGTSLSLNFSPSTVLGGLEHALGADVPWNRLVVELTEHTPVNDYDALARALAPLREAGARVAVDDAGAGFASLRHILDLHPDIIKIDIGITRGVDTDPSRASVARMLVQFAQEVGVMVIAEGVETEGERESLLGFGVTLGQGFLLGRPEIAC